MVTNIKNTKNNNNKNENLKTKLKTYKIKWEHMKTSKEI